MGRGKTKESITRIMNRMKNVHFWEIIPDMTQSEAWLLLAICEQETTNGKVSDLCDQVQMHPAAISRVMNSLEERGLIERSARKGNRRITDVHATEEGKRINMRNEGFMHRYWEEVFGRMPETDVDNLLRVLDKVVVNMENVLAESLKAGEEDKV